MASPLIPSLRIAPFCKCPNLVGTLGIMNVIAGPRRDPVSALMNGTSNFYLIMISDISKFCWFLSIGKKYIRAITTFLYSLGQETWDIHSLLSQRSLSWFLLAAGNVKSLGTLLKIAWWGHLNINPFHLVRHLPRYQCLSLWFFQLTCWLLRLEFIPCFCLWEVISWTGGVGSK